MRADATPLRSQRENRGVFAGKFDSGRGGVA